MNISPHSCSLHGLFYFGLALFSGHELDAVARGEWRMLPILSKLQDDAGQMWFILFHVPLFALIYWLCTHHSKSIRVRSQLTVDGFLIFHGIIHFLLSGDPSYAFTPPVETITVFGGALVGLTHAVIVLYPRPRSPKPYKQTGV